jgi:LacI family transcriptional regulator
MSPADIALASKPRPKLADVAARAKVSAATVSRAYNTPDIVNEKVRNRIMQVAAQLGYTPDAAARALRSGKSGIVGVIVPTLDHSIFARMINSFQERFSEAGFFTVVLSSGFDNRSTFDKAKLLVDRGAQALLVVGGVEDVQLRPMIKSLAIPAVSTYSYLEDPLVPSVGFDNYQATSRMMDYLIGLGHKRFAMIAGSPDGNDRQRSRITAYQDALRSKGLIGTDRVLIRQVTIEAAQDAGQELLHRWPDTTALVCNNDISAFTTIAMFRRKGLRVPEDISVAGFDDAEYCTLIDPQITTLRVPALDMGRHSAEILLEALKSGERPRPFQLDTELIVRASTAPPKA